MALRESQGALKSYMLGKASPISSVDFVDIIYIYTYMIPN